MKTQVNDAFVDNFFGGGSGDPISAPVDTDLNDDTIDDIIDDDEDDDKGKSDDVVKKTVLTGDKSNQALGDLLDVEIESDEGDDDKKIENRDVKKTVSNSNTETDLSEAVSQLIKDGVLMGFDDDDFSIKSVDDLKELIVANLDNRESLAIQERFNGLYESMPGELKQAMEYVSNGGRDLKTMFKKLSAITEVRDVDITEKEGQESVIKNYLLKTKFGTEEEIDEQITEWDDLDALSKKASIFKPKLDSLLEEDANEEIKREEKNRLKRQELLEGYHRGIESSVRKGVVNNIKITSAESNKIYKSLTENEYTSTISGRPINMLGKFIEDITWNEPDYDLLSELTLFAMNPEEYRKKIELSVSDKAIADNKRKLRTGDSVDNGKTDIKKITISRNKMLRK
jgi:hypothetical protein